MKTIEQQLADALNEPTTSPAFAIFSGQPLAKADTLPMYASRARIREALAGANMANLERVIMIANDMLMQEQVKHERDLAIISITAQLYTQYKENWYNDFFTFTEFLTAFKKGLI